MIPAHVEEKLVILKKDDSSGASEFIKRAIEILREFLKGVTSDREDITKPVRNLSRTIMNARPSMAPLINTVGYLLEDLGEITKGKLLKKITRLEKKRKQIVEALEGNLVQFLKEKGRRLKIMVLSYSSTILTPLKKCGEQDWAFYVLESRPLCEGRRTARILSEHFKTHLLVDAAIGKFMGEMDVVLVGIDSILKEGSVINKIGTYPLSVLAHEEGKEVWAIGDSFKYNLRSHFEEEVLIEEKPASQVYESEKEDIKVHNYYFDITPSKYLSGILSEYGALSIENFLSKIEEELPKEWFPSFLDHS